MAIYSNMSHSSNGSNPTYLDSTKISYSGNWCRICLEEVHVTSFCKLIINKAYFVRRRNSNYAKIVSNRWPRSIRGAPPDDGAHQGRKDPEKTRPQHKGAQLVFVLGHHLQPPLTLVRAMHRNLPYITIQKIGFQGKWTTLTALQSRSTKSH